MNSANTGSKNIFIEKGSILIYRVFDVAEEIDLKKVEALLRQGGDLRLELAARNRNAVVVRNAPVRFGLDEVEFKLKDFNYRAETTATVWDYGAVSIAFQIPISKGTDWKSLLNLSSLLNAPSEIVTAIDQAARKKSDEVVKLISTSLKKPNHWNFFEDYTIYFFEEVLGIKKANDLVKQTDLPALILGEIKDELADETRSAILENLFQYADDDLVLIDWNAAVVFEPSGVKEVPDILEFSLTHLLEVRYYDDLLDKRLVELYDSIEQGRQGFWHNRFFEISREANTRFIEFSEFLERMGNSLKVVGDFYLARIFRASLRRYRVHDWQESITRKMNLLAQVSDLLEGEANVRRSHFLELVIIVLILFEVVAAFFKFH
ncbi:MAG: hypothetical protein J0L93_01525 [Deltaproteobacteria bacterium]|nr:hypothetical protein [Deltaproteobacteria bacterium]